MTNKKYTWTRKEKDTIIGIVKEAKEALNMKSWVIYSRFLDGTLNPTVGPDGRMFLASAQNTVTREYEKMTVDWMPGLLADVRSMPVDEIRQTVFHELIHGLTQELYELAMGRFTTEQIIIESVERLTQRITRIVCMKTSQGQK